MFLLFFFIVYLFIVFCCFFWNIVIIVWLKINVNVNVNGMLINCVFFIFDIVYEKKFKGRVLGSL